jgi:hypothetical protein
MAQGTSDGRPPQLAIDEVGDAPEEQADRHHRRRPVPEEERVQLVAAREDEGGDDHAQRPAMEAHAALPDHQRLERMEQVVAGPVEQHVAKPATEDDAQGHPGHVVIHLLGGAGARPGLYQPARDAPAQHDAGDIGQGVPADGEGTDLQRDGVYHLPAGLEQIAPG